MGRTDEEFDQRCRLNKSTKWEMLAELETLLDQYDELIQLLRTAFELMPADDYKVVDTVDKTPVEKNEEDTKHKQLTKWRSL